MLTFQGGPPIFNFLLYFDRKQGNCKIHLSFYFWDKLLFWANTLQSRQGITLGRHNAVPQTVPKPSQDDTQTMPKRSQTDAQTIQNDLRTMPRPSQSHAQTIQTILTQEKQQIICILGFFYKTKKENTSCSKTKLFLYVFNKLFRANRSYGS